MHSHTQDTAYLEGGFQDAPVDAARAFRSAMSAMARPGQIERLGTSAPPSPLSSAAGPLLLTLADPATGVYLAGAHDTATMRAWLAFHTGAPIVAAGQAHFAVGTWDALMPLSQFSVGTSEYPDRSATLIVEMEDLRGEGVHLRGPGIKTTAALNLPDAEAMRAYHAQFPFCLGSFMTFGVHLATLPRFTLASTLADAASRI